MQNQLFFGDCLYVLRDLADEHPQGIADLIYLDPPFNSKRDYNLLFKTPKGHESDAQITAFEDSWHWGEQAEREFTEILQQPNTDVAEMMRALRSFLGENDMMAYLTMMANRLLVMRRVLRPTGCLYLHCDPTASHYLKVVLDGVFGAHRFRNEIIWKRTPFSGSSKARAQQLPKNHDVLLFYSNSDKWVWNAPTQGYTDEYLKRFKWQDSRGFYRKTLLKTFSQETFNRLREDDRLIEPVREGAKYSYKQYLDESKGVRQIDDIWIDINMINPVSNERLGYPTQKPQALLERIVSASSHEGDVVMDPFCGCGTAVHAAQKLGRRWIGIDITHLAISLIEKRLNDAFPGIKYDVHGTPKDFGGAADLAARDKYQFQWWACSLVGAQPYQGKKKGADGGIDGLIFFQDEKIGSKKIVVSVKGGDNVSVAMIRDLKGVVDREQAQIGLFVTLAPATKPMQTEAVAAGFYSSPHFGDFPKIQILTIEGLLSGSERPRYPDMSGGQTFKKASRELKKGAQEGLF